MFAFIHSEFVTLMFECVCVDVDVGDGGILVHMDQVFSLYLHVAY